MARKRPPRQPQPTPPPAAPPANLERMRNTGIIIIAALMGSLVIYGGLGWILLQDGTIKPLTPDLSRVAVWVIALAGLGLVAMGPVVANALVASQARAFGSQQPPGVPPAQIFLSTTVVGAAVVEAGGLVGLVLTLLTGEVIWVICLCGAALLLMAQMWPSRSRMENFSPPTGR